MTKDKILNRMVNEHLMSLGFDAHSDKCTLTERAIFFRMKDVAFAYSDLQNAALIERVKELESELTELKEKHKRDVIAAYRSGKSNGIDRENIRRFKGHDAAEIENVLAEDYYNETHKTK